MEPTFLLNFKSIYWKVCHIFLGYLLLCFYLFHPALIPTQLLDLWDYQIRSVPCPPPSHSSQLQVEFKSPVSQELRRPGICPAIIWTPVPAIVPLAPAWATIVSLLLLKTHTFFFFTSGTGTNYLIFLFLHILTDLNHSTHFTHILI